MGFRPILDGCVIFPSHGGYFLEPGLRGLRTLGECVDPLHATFLQHTFYMSCELFVLIQIARILKPWKRKIAFFHFSFHTFVNAQLRNNTTWYTISLSATVERAQGV